MTIMLLEWVFTSVFLILTVLVLRAAFGRRVSARLRYALWAVVLVRLLVPVQLFTSPIAGTRVFSETRVEQNVADVPDVPALPDKPSPGTTAVLPETGTTPGNVPAFPEAPTLPNAPEPPAAPDLTKAPAYLGWVWLGGSAVMALVLAASNLRFARRLRRCRIPLEGADCPLPVYAAVGLPSPCLFGLTRPAVYVTPEAAADPAMLRHVIAHEHTHFRHGDHIWSFLRCGALAVHWWNPLVWLAVTLSRRDGELVCDEGALARLGDGERLAYGNTLLALVTAKPAPGDLLCFATTMAGEKRSLKERVSRIACAPKRWLWAMVAVVLVTALACLCAFGRAEETPDFEEQLDLTADLTFSLSEADPQTVRIQGTVGEFKVSSGTSWNPVSAYDIDLLGQIFIPYPPFSEENGMIAAWWADESRTAVTVTGQPLPLTTSGGDYSGWRTFTVSLDGDNSSITESRTHGSEGNIYLASLTDGEAVTLARFAAKLLTAAEDYYKNAAAEGLPSEWEGLSPDLNRDGVPETIKVTDIPGDYVDGEKPSGQRVSVWQGDELLWSDEGYYAHAGWNAVFLCHLTGGELVGDYLLRYSPVMYQGSARYSYQLFTLENGRETVVEEAEVAFDIGLGAYNLAVDAWDPAPGDFDPDAISTFMAKVNNRLVWSTQLINTNGELLDTFQRRGGLEDDLSWLDTFSPVFVRDENDPLYGSLCGFLAAMEPYSIPTVRKMYEEGEEWDYWLQLSYHGKHRQFEGVWDALHSPDPTGQVVDLNGDGRDEIVLILQAGHGTGLSVENLYVFDAETLEQYDTATLTQGIIAQIQRTGDKDNFYLSAPGMERATIPRKLFGDVPYLADAATLGNIVYYALEDGRLRCSLGCDVSGTGNLYCGRLDLPLDFDGKGFWVAGCSYQPYREYDPARAAYREVLLGSEALFNTGIFNTDGAGWMTLDGLLKQLGEKTGETNAAAIVDFTVVDLDGDGQWEAVLNTDKGNRQWCIVLHEQGGAVYAYTLYIRWLNTFTLREDGAFSWSSSAFENGWGRLRFTETGCETVPTIWHLDETYYIGERAVPQEEYAAADEEQEAVPYAVWHEFSEENITSIFAVIG